jgi:hypothetical protein
VQLSILKLLLNIYSKVFKLKKTAAQYGNNLKNEEQIWILFTASLFSVTAE